MDIIFDKVTNEVLAELEKTQKEFWNIPRKTAVLINTFIKMMEVKNALEIGTFCKGTLADARHAVGNNDRL